MNFVKTFFAALLAIIVGGIIMLIIGVMFFVGFMAAIGSAAFGSGETPVLTDNTVLKIDLENGVSEEPAKGFIYSTFGGIFFDNSNDILQVVRAIDQATWDSKVKGIYINMRYGSISGANLEELRTAVERFKASSGKFVVAYSDSYSQMEYYFASVADRVYLNPEGNVLWKGLSSNVLFYKKMMDKLGLKAEIIRHGRFKSAVEPFMLEQMSPESRVQTSEMLTSIWTAMVYDIAASRGISMDALDNYASDLTVESAYEAQELGLIDGLLYEDQVLTLLNNLALGETNIYDLETTVRLVEEYDPADQMARGYALELDDEELMQYSAAEVDELALDDQEEAIEIYEPENSVVVSPHDQQIANKRVPKRKEPVLLSLQGYISLLQMNNYALRTPNNAIAVIYANGDIIDGEGPDGYVGSRTMMKKMSDARKDDNIKAVVLRVNSPGGSALASEVIWREVELTRAEKPVIVSMGSTAASGGYYISCGADAILVDKLTITGSIGVFGLLVDASETLEDKLGITVDVVRTNPSGDMGSPFRGVSSRERAVLQNNVEQTYGTFVNHVADGRNMQFAEVDAIGQGRVWSGVNAVNLGLADSFGGIMDAIQIAASRAGISGNYQIVPLVESYDGISSIVSSLSGKYALSKLKGELREAFVHYQSMQNVIMQSGVQARMPYIIELSE